MVITDNVYGEENIDSDVLIELINSPSVQRLKGIGQLGLPSGLSFKDGFSRFDHSIGVMILLKRLGASSEEQIAGLLHDVSHTAFSHLVDWVVGDKEKEDFQDNNHKRYVRESELPEILARHGFDTNRIVNHELFLLLEQDAPDLCADRIDYALRECVGNGRECYKRLVVRNGRILFCNERSAIVFGKLYCELQKESWGHDRARNRYQIMAYALKRAMNVGIMKFDDFWRDDAFIVNKLEGSGDVEILKCINMLKQRNLLELATTGKILSHKFRFIDPEYMNSSGVVVKLSDGNAEYAGLLNRARAESGHGNKEVDIERLLKQ